MHNLLEKISKVYYTINMCNCKVGEIRFFEDFLIPMKNCTLDNMHNIRDYAKLCINIRCETKNRE